MDEMAHSIDRQLLIDLLRVTNGTLLKFWDSADAYWAGIFIFCSMPKQIKNKPYGICTRQIGRGTNAIFCQQ